MISIQSQYINLLATTQLFTHNLQLPLLFIFLILYLINFHIYIYTYPFSLSTITKHLILFFHYSSLLSSLTMEMQPTPSCLSYITPWIATLAILLLSRRLRRRKLNLPPGPKPWPVIGNLDLIGSLPHQSIHQLSKKYGPIMHLRFGSFPIVVGSSVEMAKLFLKTQDLNFASRPKTTAGKYTTYNYSNITWSQYGPYWGQLRTMCLMELFSARRLDSYEYIRKEERNGLIREIYKSCG